MCILEKIRTIKYNRLSIQEKIMLTLIEERKKHKDEQNLLLIQQSKILLNSMYGNDSFRKNTKNTIP